MLLAQLGDIVSTWLATPKMRLEANPIARRLGWRPLTALKLAFCLLPYADPALAVMTLPVFLLVSSANTGKIWVMRAVGEEAYENWMLSAARKSRPGCAIAGVIAAAFFLWLAGAILWFLCPDPVTDWGYWFGLGIMVYAVAMAFRIRFYMDMNAREAMHVIELRTSPQGHPSYRRVCQMMHRAIAETAGHHAVAAAMRFADHTTVELAGALAVAAGATLVEKHLTYDRTAAGPDHAASADPRQFARYVSAIRLTEQLRGAAGKRVLPVEEDVRRVSRQSLVLVANVDAGRPLAETDLTTQRPGTGIPAAALAQVIGRCSRHSLPAGTMLQWDMLA
jgi:hypothetical protein